MSPSVDAANMLFANQRVNCSVVSVCVWACVYVRVCMCVSVAVCGVEGTRACGREGGCMCECTGLFV